MAIVVHELTLTTAVQIDDIGDLDIDDSQESLILSLELSLVKDLHRDDGRVFDVAVSRGVSSRQLFPTRRCRRDAPSIDSHVKVFVPVRV